MRDISLRSTSTHARMFGGRTGCRWLRAFSKAKLTSTGGGQYTCNDGPKIQRGKIAVKSRSYFSCFRGVLLSYSQIIVAPQAVLTGQKVFVFCHRVFSEYLNRRDYD